MTLRGDVALDVPLGTTARAFLSTVDLPLHWKVKGELTMRIGELAEQAGVSTKAIRYYEQIGILTPPARTASGYRSYDETAMGRLAFVRAARAVGLTLGEIRQVVAFRDQGQAPCAHVTELLHRHAADLDARILELQQLRGELRQLAERAATLDPQRCPPERVCHVIT
jgi:MerR family transcriptional regulator, copper efflux regulator